ncbi:unnamed protein product [Lasius platythorax]|uniref:Uncharacterized protein n=1 Tax=Lasius platythorax TaxID=488582 RepID=A0AAV2NT91_9HYME
MFKSGVNLTIPGSMYVRVPANPELGSCLVNAEPCRSSCRGERRESEITNRVSVCPTLQLTKRLSPAVTV